MTTQTHITTAIHSISPEMLLVDQSIKELLADVQILARILKYATPEFQENTIDEIISYIDESNIEIGCTPVDPGLTNYGKVHTDSSENTILNEGTIYFDIRFSVRFGSTPIKILINIEAQKSTLASKLGYHLENRIIYYLSRMISSQKNVEFFKSDYDSIKKVYSIWICMDSNIDDDSINELHFVQHNIFGKERNFTHLDKMHAIIINLRPNIKIKESKNKLISILEDILSNMDASKKLELLQTKHNFRITTSIERRLSNMCNLSEVFVERAFQEGMSKGISQGISQGMSQGLSQGITAFIKTLQKLNLDNDYILNEIIENFSLSKDEALKYFQ